MIRSVSIIKIWSILVFCLSVSCNSKIDNKQSKHRVNILNREMNFPAQFVKTNAEEILERLNDTLNSDDFTESELIKMRNFKRMGRNAEFFVDSTNTNSYITFHRANYLKMSKEALDVYLDLIENNILYNYETAGINTQRIEGKFLDYGLAEIVKVKYLQTYEESKRYMTHYLVSHNLKSFGIIVISTNEDDFEYILDTFKL